MRLLGGVTVAALLAAVVLLVVGSPLVGRVDGESAFAGNSVLQTVQDSTVVCTVRELRGMSGFFLSYSPNFTGPSTYPASLGVSTGNAYHSTALAYILSATYQNQQKGVVVDLNRCRHTSTFVPLSHVGFPGRRTGSTRSRVLRVGNCSSGRAPPGIAAGFAASIAVRSYTTRKLVAFGFINRTGFGGLYTSRGCVPNS